MMKALKEQSVFWSRLGICYDPPRLDRDGKVVPLACDLNEIMKYHRDFYDAGIKIHTSMLFSGWKADGLYDYELTDRTLEAIFSCGGDDLLYIPRVKLNAPVDWCKKYPEDVFVYENGPRDKNYIADLAGSLKHDLLGFDSPKGYDLHDTRPNVDGVISNQSFSSRQWLKDAGVALTKLLEHLKDSPFYKRIPAIHIAYGACGETCLWGRTKRGQFGDYGINNTRAFVDWGIRKYGSEGEVRRVWDDLSVPPSELREIETGDRHQWAIDYDIFMGDINVAACDYFGGVVREHASDKLVGVFYGYMLEVARSAYTGHLNFDAILSSPNVDFLCGPKSYYRNQAGQPGGELAPAQSINLRKAWFDEIDIRTHLTKEDWGYSCRSFTESKYCLWREFAKNLAHDSGMWWMDLGGGWYDDPQIMNEITKMEKIAHKLRGIPHHRVAEVLLLINENVVLRQGTRYNLHQMMMKDAIRNIHLCGLPIDLFRIADLSTLNLARYKAVLLLNTGEIDVSLFASETKIIEVHDDQYDFRAFFADANCEFKAPPEHIVFEDNRFLAVFPSKDFENIVFEEKQ